MEPDPQMFVELTTVRSPLEAEAVIAALAERGIDAQGFNHAASMLGSISLNVPYSVSVKREDFETARALLADIRAESAAIDWDQVDVGEMPAEVKRELDRGTAKFPRMVMYLGAVLAIVAFVVILLNAIFGGAVPGMHFRF